ncbi:ras-related protein Rab-32 [Eurytemora carolleeae]|uniref:ras-related protein Rab-32 n=1 Tax=Eurytemora carolleeae TaxID=1294199 RepID=UPI000C760FAC|nr:ras-related protein Rab-32 [Eurytemora carolleeae]XP_023335789.1 ras-related protein Rab-32 [Eurytemora carolleeae]XP_023335790.1 ras-related protein Rab-32 [Eurytemora carolleeae]|eukprot:XP_023335788.1 ras-related protein Rab-32-like [Eurytemora affinis]
MSSRDDYIFKVLVIGEVGSGKTSIIKRYVHQFFSQHYRATIGVDFALKTVNLDKDTVVRLQLWDIAGQERFGNMTRVYYRDAAAAFIVFDLSRVATLEAAVKWKLDLDQKVLSGDGRPVPAILLGNKCDLPREPEMPTDEEISEFCKKHGFAGWSLVSAKEGNGIDEAGLSLVQQLVSREERSDNRLASPIFLHNSDRKPDKKTCFCG